MIEFLLKLIIMFGFAYYLESRIVYAYEYKSHKFPCSVAKEKIIKNKFCKFIFPIEHKSYREAMGDSVTKISVFGLIHFIIFYIPLQITCIVSFVSYFLDKDIAEILLKSTYIILMSGLGFFAFYCIILCIIELWHDR